MLNVRTSRSEEQFDQGLHCMPFYQYFLNRSKDSQTDLITFYVNYGGKFKLFGNCGIILYKKKYKKKPPKNCLPYLFVSNMLP